MRGNSLLFVAMLAVVGLVCLAPSGVLGGETDGGSGIGSCKYNAALGFNPFERWGVVALGELNSMKGHFEGRILAQYAVLTSSNISANAKKYAPKSDTPWAVTVHKGHAQGKELQINGEPDTLIYGGVEAQGKIVATSGLILGNVISVESSVEFSSLGHISGTVQSKLASPISVLVPWSYAINTELELSVPFDKVGNYFKQLSDDMSKLPESILGLVERPEAGTIVITLRSKVNVVSTQITAAELFSTNTIVLKGHPRGILIINIDEVGNFDTFEMPFLSTLVVKHDDGSTVKDAAFGRVLINYHKAVGIGFFPYAFDGKSGKTAAEHFAAAMKEKRVARPQFDNKLIAVSILAPFASMFSMAGVDIKGNVITKSFVWNNGQILTQPFGSFPRGTGARPVGSGGIAKPAGGAACWWGLF